MEMQNVSVCMQGSHTYIRTWSTIYTLRKFNFCLAVSDEIFDLFPSKLTRLYVTQSFAIVASVTYSTGKSSKTLLRVYSSLVSGSLTMQSGCRLVFYSFSSQRKHFANFFCNNVTKIQNFALREKTNFIIFYENICCLNPILPTGPLTAFYVTAAPLLGMTFKKKYNKN